LLPGDCSAPEFQFGDVGHIFWIFSVRMNPVEVKAWSEGAFDAFRFEMQGARLTVF
jgi:hypothetical protein